MATQLEITVSDHQPASVVALAGELDIATGELLRGTVRNLIRHGSAKLVVDTTALRFCDSSGLEVLLESRDEAERAGGSMRLTGVHGILKLVLEVTRLIDAFPVDDTPVEAVAALIVTPTRNHSMV